MKSYSKQALVDVATEQWETAHSYLQRVEDRYRFPINVLKDAMENDPDVLSARKEELEARNLMYSARGIAKENQEK